MITPPITAEVIENPMKTLACDVQEKQENINQNTYQWWLKGRVLETAPPSPSPSPSVKVWICHCIHEGRSSFQVHKQRQNNNQSQSAIINTVFKSDRLRALANY